jgi:hypothetical protein
MTCSWRRWFLLHLLGLGHDFKLMCHDLAQDMRRLQFFELLLIDDSFHQVIIGLPETLKDLAVDLMMFFTPKALISLTSTFRREYIDSTFSFASSLKQLNSSRRQP